MDPKLGGAATLGKAEGNGRTRELSQHQPGLLQPCSLGTIAVVADDTRGQPVIKEVAELQKYRWGQSRLLQTDPCSLGTIAGDNWKTRQLQNCRFTAGAIGVIAERFATTPGFGYKVAAV